MEFLLIGESKLKIVLTEADMKEYGLRMNGESPDGGGRRSMWRILDLARAEVGFDPSGDKILIQFYPQKGLGCEVFVTKLGILPDSSARMVSKSDRVSLLSRRLSCFRFDTLEALIAAARSVKARCEGIRVEADVYKSRDSYFMSVEEYGKGGEPAEFPQLSEFGERLTAECGAYIGEHFDKILHADGIETLAML